MLPPPFPFPSLTPPIIFQYGSGLTHNNQLTGESSGGEVTEVVKKVLDERMTRQHQIREQVRICVLVRYVVLGGFVCPRLFITKYM